MTDAARPGSAEGRPWSGDDAGHNDACHQRWRQRLRRDTGGPGYREKWYDEQCGGCRYWIALRGELGRDYGACTHPGSAHDGQVRFEHDGCPVFTERADGSFG
ncbi:DUF3027 domain-containing protein [Micromonospora auratinigra]|uniref:DUF3027 domain-containing protein n=1 Tax=Micromonospora auratinigra TaxID=261654 RepID=A0A1A8Z8A4_9ACTN|nr:DUF3027 domain-containing protein [Micromonospora auratinigra]SBT40067.1 Protein of unknown function (DUF3027) [Micromonospora auratinigra]